MDQLSDDQMIGAWKASWNPSFSGMAIVNKDFEFVEVNPQFCKLLGVTPAELIGHRFQDITPPGIRELDEKNAKLLMDGLIDFYLLPKTYEFTEQRKIDVVLLVTRIPPSTEGEFELFLSRIMLDEKKELLSARTEKRSNLPAPSQKLTVTVVDFLIKYWVWLVMAAAAATGFIIELFDMVRK